MTGQAGQSSRGAAGHDMNQSREPRRRIVNHDMGPITGNTDSLGWEHFAHQADIGIRGFGPTCSAAFEEAAKAMSAVVADLAAINDSVGVEVHCKAPDKEILFVEWLNAVIFEMATQRMLFRRFDVHIAGNELTGVAWGEVVDIKRHAPAVEIKGATFTCLAVHRRENGVWVAQCVVDV